MNKNFETLLNFSFMRCLLCSVSWTVYLLFIRKFRKQWGLVNYAEYLCQASVVVAPTCIAKSCVEGEVLYFSYLEHTET